MPKETTVTLEDLYLLIGRQTVEIVVLRTHLDRLLAAQPAAVQTDVPEAPETT